MLATALRSLWWTQVRARGRKLLRSVWSPRRASLSLLGLVLGCVWLSAAVLDLMFRAPFGADRVYRMIVSGLASYTMWHLLRRVWERPEQAIDWSPVEQELICGGPFTRAERIGYRVFTIFSAALLKTGCFVLLMWPDLRQPSWGFWGVLGGLMLVDFFRMIIEAITWSMGEQTYRTARTVVTGSIAIGAAWCLAVAVGQPGVWHEDRGIAPWTLLQSASQAALALGTNPWGCWVTVPFSPFGHLVVGEGTDESMAYFAALGLLELIVLSIVVVRVDAAINQFVQRREEREYAAVRVAGFGVNRSGEVIPRAENQPVVRRAEKRAGWRVGHGPWALLWRQWLGFRQRQASILAGLVIATLLIVTPVLSGNNHRISFAYVLGSLIFYSWVLLPANIKLDFRRDIERIYLLKLLPLRPWQIVASQIGLPVAILTVYQVLVLTLVCCLQPVPLLWWLGSLLILVPTNVAIVTLENLIYLWYPFRVNQEGIEIFIRTTLAFTGKSVVYAGGIGLLVAWGIAATALVNAGLVPLERSMLFLLGVIGLCASVAAAIFRLLVRAYDRFDPTTDLPAA